MKKSTSILITQNGVSYHFAEVLSTSDGSLEIAFPTIKETSGIKHSIQLTEQAHAIEPILIDRNTASEKDDTQCYISYHTSGTVNYHKMTFHSTHMEPLFNISEKNTFFIYSFVFPNLAFKTNYTKTNSNAINIDTSDLTGKRINILLSVCPTNFSLQHINSFMISFPIYNVYVELLDDATSFNFSKLYKEIDCVKIRPRLDKFPEQHVTKEQAFLSYQHTLYQPSKAIVLPPNGEGILNVIFSSEMRIPPWLHIEFANPNLSAKVIVRKTTHLTFKVFDRKHNQYIKKAENIQITRLSLDAEIYGDSTLAPPNFI